MGIHHSSDTKTSHDHDNNCQICHSTASLSRAGRLEAERRLRLARGGGGGRLADTSLRVGRALGCARSGSGRAAAPTCDPPLSIRFHEQQNRTELLHNTILQSKPLFTITDINFQHCCTTVLDPNKIYYYFISQLISL